MKLCIVGLKKTFDISEMHLVDDCITVTAFDLTEYVEGLQTPVKVEAETPPPPPPVDVTYEKSESCPHDIDTLKKAGWTQDQLIAKGFLVEVVTAEPEAAPPPPPADEPSAPPVETIALAEGEFEVDGKVYKMCTVANGVPYKQFAESSEWSLELLLKHKYCEFIRDASTPVPPPVPEAEKTYPFMNDAGDWEDSTGATFDAEKHGMTDAGIPGVTVKGKFKARRGTGKKAANAPLPPPDDAGGNPKADAPPPPEGNVVGEEDIEAELASLIKDWKS